MNDVSVARWQVAARIAAVLALLGCCARAAAAGIAVPIGGALRYDNAAVWSRLVDLSGGAGSRWVVLATAAEDPDAVAARIVATLQRHGARAEHIAVAPRLPGIDLALAVRDPRWLARVRAARGVFFSGGAQERIVETLLPGGVSTPLLDAIREMFAAGGVVAGTSAGAAIMSRVMFRDAGDIMTVLRGALREGAEIDRGLGFVAPDLVVDQHFLRRGRIGRLLPLMLAKDFQLGLGVDEDTAAIVRGEDVEVIGSRSVLFVDLATARSDASRGAFNISGARLSLLANGDHLNLRTREVTPVAAKRSAGRIDPAAPGFKPFYPDAPFHADILADSALQDAMTRVVDGRDAETRGLAFDLGHAGSRAELGFEFRLYRDAGTLGWFSSSAGGESYTLADVRLDVTPVRVATPLYSPWRAP